VTEVDADGVADVVEEATEVDVGTAAGIAEVEEGTIHTISILDQTKMRQIYNGEKGDWDWIVASTARKP